MKTPAHIFWVFANWYGALLGTSLLARLHYINLTLALHGLGYDNARHTGEEWFIKHILKNSDIQTAIDVGANVGAYSALLAENIPGNIYAIEPSASSFAQLEKVAARYAKKIIPIKAALSDKNGTATLFSRTELSEKATLDPSPDEDVSSMREEVRTCTVDELIREHTMTRVDFIKIDTEGHEQEVFSGMKETVANLKPKFIQFEFNRVHLYRGVTLWSLCQQLQEYEFYRLLPRGLLKIDPAKQANNVFMFCNIIAKRIS